MPKVIFCAYDQPGSVTGPGSWIKRLLPALRARGIEVDCLFLIQSGESGATIEFLRGEGFSCPAILAPETSYDRIQWILKMLTEFSPDLFVPNQVVAAYHAARWVRTAGIPTIGILHSDDGFHRAIQDRFVFGRRRDRLSGLICVSRELERQVTARGPRDTQIERIGYGVPIPAQTVERVSGVLRVAYVGRLAEEQKRISTVASAFCRAASVLPGVECVIYGDGPQRDEVMRILAHEGNELPVRLGGRIDSNDIQNHMLECDVIVLLSDYEGLPIALMEAMACGCVPVCLQMRSGIPELVESGETGLLVSDRGDSFIAELRRLQDDKILWERLSRGARALIVKEHSFDAAADRWASLIQRLHAAAGKRRYLAVPRFLNLAAVHPALASADIRRTGPPFLLKYYRRSRIWAGRLRRKLLGHPLP